MLTFGERLSELRKHHKLKQVDFAKILGISVDMLSKYERGKVMMPDDIKIKVAKYFDISLDYLFGLIDTEVSYCHKDCIMLPKYFTKEATNNVKHYINLLSLEIQEGK